MFDKKASTQFPINELLASRWSGRAYDPDRPLTSQQLITLMEAGRWAPSCFGDEPWRFIICDRASNNTAWEQAFDCLVEGNQAWARQAPVLVIITADTQFEHNGKPNKFGQYDTGAAAMSICLQATDMGLMAHQMGGFDPAKASETFAIPERYVPIAMMTLGYQLAKAHIPEDMKERELAERKRKPLGDCFFDGVWGRGIV